MSQGNGSMFVVVDDGFPSASGWEQLKGLVCADPVILSDLVATEVDYDRMNHYLRLLVVAGRIEELEGDEVYLNLMERVLLALEQATGELV